MNGAERPAHVGEEARLEMAMAAAGAERSNRPRHLVLGSLVVLAAALVYLFVAMGSRASASGRLQRAKTEIAGLQRVVTDLRQTSEVGQAKKYEPSNLVVPYLEGLAGKQNLHEVEVKAGNDSTSGPEGFVQRSYRVTVSDKDPARLFGWIDEAVRGHPIGEGGIEPVPGLEVGSIKLTPGFTDQEEDKVKWNLEITFKRWERRS